MNTRDISKLIHDIYFTKGGELVCTEVQALLPVFIDADFEGEVLATAVSQDIEIHLHHCPDCTELYRGLYFLVEQEAAGALALEEPPHPTLPPQHKPGTLTPVAGS